MGGQGGGVLCNWIIQTAERNNYFAQSTSVPGVAQRTGATLYYLELSPRANDTDRKPLLALMPVPGHVDLVVAGELIESGRAILRGLVTADRTTTIVSTHRDYAVAEKSAMADGRVDSSKLIAATEKHSKTFIGFDMAALAENNNSVISSVLFGSIAASGVLPFTKESFESVITESGIAIEANLKGFEAGYAQAQHHPDIAKDISPDPKPVVTKNRRIQAILDRVENTYPQQCRGIVIAALRKLVDYQDVRYAEDYLDRLDKVLLLDKSAKNYLLTRETARFLALWMSFEDTVRIADLKTRSSRIVRVRKDVLAQTHQPVRIHEYMHPRIEEICDTMPASLGSWCLQSNLFRRVCGRFCKKGKRITTTSLAGFLLLYSLAGLRRFRRSSLRYKVEMNAIEQWLSSIVATAGDNYELALEISACQGLVKGYGDTHARGMHSFKLIMQALEGFRNNVNAAEMLCQLREAALADEHGEELNEQLQNIA